LTFAFRYAASQKESDHEHHIQRSTPAVDT
jgi:hypothetical protein